METTPAPETPRRYFTALTLDRQVPHAVPESLVLLNLPPRTIYYSRDALCGVGIAGLRIAYTQPGTPREWDPEDPRACHKCGSVILASDPYVFMDEDVSDLI